MQQVDIVPAPALRVLIVEDDEDDYAIISDYIQYIPGQDCQTAWCKDYQGAIHSMQKSEYDVYFIDYYLTGKTGLDLLTEAMIDGCEEPIIILTGKGNPAVDKKAMLLGAADYLIKSELSTEKLERCIRYALGRASTLRDMRESERQYRNIFERTNDIIFIANIRLRFRKLNEAAARIFGYPIQELLNQSLCDLLLNDSDKEWIEARLTSTGRIEGHQVELICQNKEKKIGILSASVETDMRGNPYVQGIIHDITLLKRTEEITIQMEKLDTKGLVIRTLAHEVRNPLNNILLSVTNLKTATPDESMEYLEIIQRNSKRIDDLINELMDSADYYKMQLAVVSLQTVMDSAIEVALDRMTLSKIKLHLNYSRDHAFALADKGKLRVAFLNLIVNAIEAMEKTGGTITISVQRKPDFHEVSIQDTGCGMSAETIQKLFEPYYTSKPHGLGLGLATTHAIVISHKGTILVSSMADEGSVFTMTFPTCDAP